MKCKTCEHYLKPTAALHNKKLYEMYCQQCKRYPDRPDNYTPISPKSLRNAPYAGHEEPHPNLNEDRGER